VFALGYESGIAFVVRGSWFVVCGLWFVVRGPVFVLGRDRDCDCAARSYFNIQLCYASLVQIVSVGHFQGLLLYFGLLLPVICQCTQSVGPRGIDQMTI